MEVILLIDVGNTSLKWLVTPKVYFKPLEYGAIPLSELEKGLKILRKIWIKNGRPPVFFASVKPSVNPALENLFHKPRMVSVCDVQKLIDINYKTPETLGVDRLLNALGGLNYGETFAVVSLGSATVIDLILYRTFQGGSIFLGLENHLKCLFNRTEQLPLVKLEKDISIPGKSTRESILSGVLIGTIYSIKGFLEDYSERFGTNLVLLTGGYADTVFTWLVEELKTLDFILDKFLTFKGLFRISQLD